MSQDIDYYRIGQSAASAAWARNESTDSEYHSKQRKLSGSDKEDFEKGFDDRILDLNSEQP